MEEVDLLITADALGIFGLILILLILAFMAGFLIGKETK